MFIYLAFLLSSWSIDSSIFLHDSNCSCALMIHMGMSFQSMDVVAYNR